MLSRFRLSIFICKNIFTNDNIYDILKLTKKYKSEENENESQQIKAFSPYHFDNYGSFQPVDIGKRGALNLLENIQLGYKK